MGPRVYDPVQIFRQFRFVSETLGPNRGVWVEAFQRIGDGQPGDSWCMDILSAVLWICYQGPAPIPRTGSCNEAYSAAKRLGFLVADPQPGDVFFRVRPSAADAAPDSDPHHAGLVTAGWHQANALTCVGTIAGNTTRDGRSSNGTGVFEHDQPRDDHFRFARLPLAA